MRALASPASCKGVLSAVEAAMALGAGMRVAGVEAEELPVADGGEGTVEVLAAALGGEWRTAPVSDPLGRAVAASFLVLEDGTAVVEAAQAIGLRRLAEDERDPMRASSLGLGELVLAAAAEAAGPLLVCLGDSATVDG
ncbi:MAG: glycerate kinase, partial [Actinobacteria bacterium]